MIAKTELTNSINKLNTNRLSIHEKKKAAELLFQALRVKHINKQFDNISELCTGIATLLHSKLTTEKMNQELVVMLTILANTPKNLVFITLAPGIFNSLIFLLNAESTNDKTKLHAIYTLSKLTENIENHDTLIHTSPLPKVLASLLNSAKIANDVKFYALKIIYTLFVRSQNVNALEQTPNMVTGLISLLHSAQIEIKAKNYATYILYQLVLTSKNSPALTQNVSLFYGLTAVLNLEQASNKLKHYAIGALYLLGKELRNNEALAQNVNLLPGATIVLNSPDFCEEDKLCAFFLILFLAKKTANSPSIELSVESIFTGAIALLKSMQDQYGKLNAAIPRSLATPRLEETLSTLYSIDEVENVYTQFINGHQAPDFHPEILDLGEKAYNPIPLEEELVTPIEASYENQQILAHTNRNTYKTNLFLFSNSLIYFAWLFLARYSSKSLAITQIADLFESITPLFQLSETQKSVFELRFRSVFTQAGLNQRTFKNQQEINRAEYVFNGLAFSKNIYYSLRAILNSNTLSFESKFGAVYSLNLLAQNASKISSELFDMSKRTGVELESSPNHKKLKQTVEPVDYDEEEVRIAGNSHAFFNDNATTFQAEETTTTETNESTQTDFDNPFFLRIFLR